MSATPALMGGIIGFVLLSVFGRAAAFDRTLSDRRWEQMMLHGKYGTAWIYLNEEKPPWPENRIESRIAYASSTRYGIVVHDKDKDSFFGLAPGSGWLLDGGLLGRTELPEASVELFGKAATKISPWGTSKPERDMWVDFFLVTRPKGGGAATVIRKWTFNPGQIAVTYEPGNPHGGIYLPRYTVGGTLRYDAQTGEVEVSLQGLVKPVVERVPLPGPASR